MRFIDTSIEIIFDTRFKNFFLIKITTLVEDLEKGFPIKIELKDQVKIPCKAQFPKIGVLEKMMSKLDELKKAHPFFLLKKCESPIEVKFYVYALHTIPQLRPQIEVGPYRVDFAVPERKLLIELDGHDFHKTRQQRTYDAKRDRYLIKDGWRVLHFTGSEIHNNVFSCIDEIKTIVAGVGNKL